MVGANRFSGSMMNMGGGMFPWDSVIGAGGGLLGGLFGGIFDTVNQRRDELGRARQAAKLDDIGKMFANYQVDPRFNEFLDRQSTGSTFSPVDTEFKFDPTSVRAGSISGLGGGLTNFADNVLKGGSQGDLRAQINRELAANMRNANAGYAGLGANQGAAAGGFGQLQANAIGQLAQSLNQDALARQQMAGGFLGQGLQMNQAAATANVANRLQADQFNSGQGLQAMLEAARLKQSGQTTNAQLGMQEGQFNSQQQAQMLQFLEQLKQSNLQSQAGIYGSDAFATPRYNPQTGKIEGGK